MQNPKIKYFPDNGGLSKNDTFNLRISVEGVKYGAYTSQPDLVKALKQANIPVFEKTGGFYNEKSPYGQSVFFENVCLGIVGIKEAKSDSMFMHNYSGQQIEEGWRRISSVVDYLNKNANTLEQLKTLCKEHNIGLTSDYKSIEALFAYILEKQEHTQSIAPINP